MKWIKRIFGFLLLLITVVLVHYYLPQNDIVKVVDTDVKRMDIKKGSPFWDRQDAGTNAEETRDVRFIFTVKPNGKTMVYRNEDTGWSFPFYLKFDSSDLSAKAQDMSKTEGQWVAVRHYGWRIRLFSIFPNATKIRKVDGPDAFIIPWFNIAFLSLIAIIVFMIWRAIRRWKKKNVDPIADKIGDELAEAKETMDDHAAAAQRELNEKRTGFKAFMRKWFGSS